MKIIVALSVLLFGVNSSLLAAEEIPIDITGGQSPAFDLVETPLAVAVLHEISLSFRDAILQDEFNKNMDDLTKVIDKSLAGRKGLGYLLKVEFYVDEFGVPLVPGGQLIYPIGIDTEPVGALAEYKREGVVRPERKYGHKNMSYYLWVVKDGSLKVKHIPKKFRKQFEREAIKKKRERSRMAAFGKSVPDGAAAELQRATYWKEQYDRYNSVIQDADRRARVSNLTKRMDTLEENLNATFAKYQDTLEKYKQEQGRLEGLRAIQNITNLLNQAAAVGSAVTPENKTPKTEGTPSEDIRKEVAWTKRELKIKGKELDIQYTESKILFDDYHELNKEIYQNYSDENIPIPRAPQLTPVLPIPRAPQSGTVIPKPR